MRRIALLTALLAATSPVRAQDQPVTAAEQAAAAVTPDKTFRFPMVVSPGAKTCLPKAAGTVTDHSFGPFENLEVQVTGLPPNTDFDFFIIQVPNSPFGLA